MQRDLVGLVALVTGAGGRHGIGRAVALRLAERGADVAVTDLASPTGVRAEDAAAGWRGVESVAAEIEALGSRALAIHGDVSVTADVEAIMDACRAHFERIDILVSNAASAPGRDRQPIVDVDDEAFDDVMRVNVRGTFLVTRAVARQMVARRAGGRILLMSSCMGLRGQANYAAYSASKFALVGYCQSLALELGRFGITVNAICPGPVDTERFDHVAAFAATGDQTPSAFREELLRARAASTPLGRNAQTSDVAGVVAFLASAEASFLTGLAVGVSGGFAL